MFLPPSHNPSSGNATMKADHTIWAPSIPLIDETELHQTISIHGILTQASQLRNGIDCTFAFRSDMTPFSGGQCIVFVVEYADSVRCAFRLPYHSRDSKIHDWRWLNELDHWKDFMKAEVPLVPQIVGSGLSTDNAIGFPFVAYEWMEEKPLLWTDHQPQDRAQRDEIIKSLARFTIETACRLQKPGKTGAEVYVTQAIDRKIKRVLNGKLRTAKLMDCLRQRSLIRRYLIPELDGSPWVMVHGDLSGTNIVVDGDNVISGVIDFGFAEYLPLQFAAVFPRILDHETYQDPDDVEIEPETAADVESSLVWRSKNTETKRRDRHMFLDTVKSLCDTHGETCSSFYRVLASRDEIRRYWWFTAISNQKLHQAMVKVDWLLHEMELADLDLEKERALFRLTNPGYQAGLI